MSIKVTDDYQKQSKWTQFVRTIQTDVTTFQYHSTNCMLPGYPWRYLAFWVEGIMKLSLRRDWTPSPSCAACPSWRRPAPRSPPLDTRPSLVSLSASNYPWTVNIVVALCKLTPVESMAVFWISIAKDLLAHLNQRQQRLNKPLNMLCAYHFLLLVFIACFSFHHLTWLCMV